MINITTNALILICQNINATLILFDTTLFKVYCYIRALLKIIQFTVSVVHEFAVLVHVVVKIPASEYVP